MLDFATLTQARQGLQQADRLRHQQSTELYAQGRQLIRTALQPRVDKAKLKQATDCFAKGIQANYKNPANYFGMGFLFLLIAQPRQALPYLKAGLDLEPGSELGKALLEQAQQIALPKAAPPQQAAPLPDLAHSSAEIDFDELYDTTEAAILLFLRQIMSDEVLGFAPAPDPQQCEVLHTKLNHFQAKTQAFNQRLQLLDQEMEVSDLRMQLGTVDKALQRMMALHQLFEQFIDIHRDIQHHIQLTDEMIAESQTTAEPKDIDVLEENLQVLLDHCDSVADRLDELDAKRVNIHALQTTYEQYVEQLERFQDVLEETLDRLKSS